MNSIRHQRLHNQHLLMSSFKDPVAVVKSLIAVQAQDYHGVKWALGQRMVSCTDDEIEQAFAAGRILRLHVIRPTWHFVAPDDIRWLVRLTAPRVIALCRHYYRKYELDDPLFKRTNRAIVKALRGGRHLTRDELRVAVTRAGIEPGDSVRFGYIMHRSELDGLVCSGARKGNQFTYALLDERVPASRSLDHDDALGELTKRYFTSRGPATIQDYVWWSGLTVADARRGIEIVRRSLISEVVKDKTYWFSVTLKPTVKNVARKVHLLPAYDEYFIGYKDRSAAIHPHFNLKNMAPSVVFGAPLVVDGQVVGGWKRVTDQKSVTIQLKPFFTLTRTDRTSLTGAAEKYADFLEKSARVEWL